MTPRYLPEPHEIDALRRLARRLTRGDGASAEDLVQETLLVVLRMDRPLERPHVGWLLGIARNVFRNQRRGEKRRALRERAFSVPPAGDDPARLVERAELARVLERAVARLPDHYREVLVQRFRDGLTSEGIASRLAIAPASVRSRMLRALELLRARLDRRAIAALPFFDPRAQAAPGAAISRLARTTARAAALRVTGVAACVVGGSILLPRLASPREDSIPLVESSVVVAPRAEVSETTSLSLDREDSTDPSPGPETAASCEAAIVGRVVGDPRFVPAKGTLWLEARGEIVEPPIAPLEPTFTGDGEFRFDLAPWRDFAPLIRGSFLRFDHPDYLPLTRSVELIDAHGDMRQGTTALAFGLDPIPASIAAGRVVDAAGGFVAGARVVARRIGTDGSVGTPEASVETGAKGEYRLRLGGESEWSLTAVAADGRRSEDRRGFLRIGGNPPVELRLGETPPPRSPQRVTRDAAAAPSPPPPLDAIVTVSVHDRRGKPFTRLCAAIGAGDAFPYSTAGRPLGDGRFEVLVPAGRRRLALFPGATSPVDAVFLPTQFEIDAAKGQRLSLAFVAREGGRLFARAVDRSRAGVACAAEVRDAAENVVIRRFVSLAPGGSYGDGKLSAKDGSRGDRPLPPGNYTLVVRPGEPGERRVPIAIEPLVTTNAMVTLDS
jgi:RNA polymerase sigma-70 factor (ECF subfamily)